MSCFRTVNVSVPKKTRNNGTLYAYIFLHHAGILPWHDGKQVHLVSPLTTYMVPKPEEVNLLTGESAAQVGIFIRLSAKGACTLLPGIHTCMSLYMQLRSRARLLANMSVFHQNNFPRFTHKFFVKLVTCTLSNPLTFFMHVFSQGAPSMELSCIHFLRLGKLTALNIFILRI